MARDRDEASIKRLDSYFGREFDNALSRVLGRYRGLSFYTDEQLAEIREQMVRDELFRRKLKWENRKRRAA